MFLLLEQLKHTICHVDLAVPRGRRLEQKGQNKRPNTNSIGDIVPAFYYALAMELYMILKS